MRWHRMVWIGVLAVLVVSGLVVGARAQDLPPDHPPVDNTANGIPERPSAAAGEPVYAESCAPCHGPTGQGDGPAASGLPVPPTAFADPPTLRRLSPQQIFTVIQQGRIERGMPPWANRLSPDVIWSVVAYLLDLNLSPEEYAAGQAVYREVCAACHGPKGRGDGPEAMTLDVPDLTRWPDWVQVANDTWVARILEDPVHAQAVAGRSREAIEQAVAYVRTLSYSSTHAPLEGEGVIEGKVEMQTPGARADFTGLEVTLFGFRGSMEPQLVLTTTVTSSQTFRFEGLSTEPDVLYALSVTWEGASYGSGVLAFPPEQSVITATIRVAATTEEDPGLRADRVHWFIDLDEEGVVIGELVSLTNPGDRTYIGTPIPGQEGKRAVIRWPLPPGAVDVRVDGGPLGDRFLLMDGALVDTLPITPGADARRLLFRYRLPRALGDVQIVHPLPVPVNFLNVFIADRGEKVEVPSYMVKGQTQNVGDVPFLSYMATNLPAGETVTITLRDIPAAPTRRTGTVPPRERPVRWVGLVLAGLFGAGLLGSMVYLGRHRHTQARTRRALLTRRDALLREIAWLDEQYEAGALDEATYREARDVRMAEAVRLTLMLEEDKRP